MACELPSLPQQLLGNVLLADSLSKTHKLAAIHPRCRFITRVGELLDADGTLTIGPPEAEAGLVSRKSELRELREQFRACCELVASTELELAEIRRQADAASGVIEAVGLRKSPSSPARPATCNKRSRCSGNRSWIWRKRLRSLSRRPAIWRAPRCGEAKQRGWPQNFKPRKPSGHPRN